MKNQNTIIVSLVIITLLGIVGVYVYKSNTKSQPVEIASISSLSKVSSSLSIASSSNSKSSQVVSSSSAIAVSSKTLAVSSSSIQQSSQAIEIDTDTPIPPEPQKQFTASEYKTGINCDQEDSGQFYVKTQYGCYVYFFANESIPRGMSNKEYQAIVNEITKEYYTQMYSKYVTKKHYIFIEPDSQSAEDKSTFYITVSIEDPDYFVQKGIRMNGAFRNGIVYSIYQENNVWKYKVNKAIDSPYNQ